MHLIWILIDDDLSVCFMLQCNTGLLQYAGHVCKAVTAEMCLSDVDKVPGTVSPMYVIHLP